MLFVREGQTVNSYTVAGFLKALNMFVVYIIDGPKFDPTSRKFKCLK